MDKLHKLLQKPLEQKEVELSDLPDLDLYMDQIITLFSDKSSDSSGLLTKTMINNYSKEGLLKPIKGKKYSKEHILQMLLIYRLKQTLSIHEIKGVMQGLDSDAAKNDGPSHRLWQQLYGAYLDSREQNAEAVSIYLDSLLKENPADSQEKAALLLLQLSWVSYMTSQMCHALVAEHFPMAEKEKKKDREK